MEETTKLDAVSQPRGNDDCTVACCPTCRTHYQTASSSNSSGQGDAHLATCPNAGHQWHARAKDIKQSITLVPDSYVLQHFYKGIAQAPLHPSFSNLITRLYSTLRFQG